MRRGLGQSCNDDVFASCLHESRLFGAIKSKAYDGRSSGKHYGDGAGGEGEVPIRSSDANVVNPFVRDVGWSQEVRRALEHRCVRSGSRLTLVHQPSGSTSEGALGGSQVLNGMRGRPRYHSKDPER